MAEKTRTVAKCMTIEELMDFLAFQPAGMKLAETLYVESITTEDGEAQLRVSLAPSKTYEAVELTKVWNVQGMFAGCTGLSPIPSIPGSVAPLSYNTWATATGRGGGPGTGWTFRGRSESVQNMQPGDITLDTDGTHRVMDMDGNLVTVPPSPTSTLPIGSVIAAAAGGGVTAAAADGNDAIGYATSVDANNSTVLWSPTTAPGTSYMAEIANLAVDGVPQTTEPQPAEEHDPMATLYNSEDWEATQPLPTVAEQPTDRMPPYQTRWSINESERSE